MKNILYKSALIGLSAGMLVSCKPNLKVTPSDKGNIDPSRYVAVGNSITWALQTAPCITTGNWFLIQTL